MPEIQFFFQTCLRELFQIRDAVNLLYHIFYLLFDFFYCVCSEYPGKFFQRIFFFGSKRIKMPFLKNFHFLFRNIQRKRFPQSQIMEGGYNGPAHHAFPDQMTDPQAAHLLVDVFPMLCDIKTDPPLFQSLGQSFQSVRRSDIQAVDRSGIEDHGFCIFLKTVLNILLEDLNIGKEKIFTEPVDLHIFYRIGEAVFPKIIKILLPRHHTLKIPGRICGFQDHCCKRQKDPYHYSVDGPQKKDSGSGGHENKKFLPAYFEQPYSKVPFHNTHQSGDHNGSQHRYREISDKAGGAQKDHAHDNACSQRYSLGLPSILIVHGSPGNTAVYRTAADGSRGQISRRIGQDLLTVIERIIVFGGKVVGPKKGFRHDHHRYHQSPACRLGKIYIGKIREKKPWKSGIYLI